MQAFILLFILSSSAWAQFSPGQVILAEDLNDKFDGISYKLQSRGIPYTYDQFTPDQKISSETINQNFNNFKLLAPITLHTFAPNQAVQASKINQNFSLIEQTIIDNFNRRSCNVDNGTGYEHFDENTNQWNQSCLVDTCIDNFHIENNLCFANTKSCPIDFGIGSQTWTGSSYNSCTIVSCNQNYHITNNSCSPNIQSCFINNGTGSQYWAGTQFSPCTIVSCNESFHLENSQCLSNSISCPVTAGIGARLWNQQNQNYDECKIISCTNPAHYPNMDNTACIPNNSIACTNQIDSNNNTVGFGTYNYNGTTWSACEITSCISGYTLSNGSCSCSGDSCLVDAATLNTQFDELQTILRNKGETTVFDSYTLNQPISATTLNTNFNKIKTYDASHQIVTYSTNELVSIARFNLNMTEAKRIANNRLYYKNCAEIKYFNPSSLSQGYVVDSDGFGNNAEFTVWCDMSETEGMSVVMKLSSNQFAYGSANWTSTSGVNEPQTHTASPYYPSNGLDSKNRAYFRFNRSYKIRIDARRNGIDQPKLDFTFSSQNSPMNLMITGANSILSMPTYTQWKNVFGHDRSSNPTFERNGTRTPSRGLAGCGKPMMFGWQANDPGNDTSSGLGQHTSYCGGGGGTYNYNWSVSGYYSYGGYIGTPSPLVIVLETSRVWALPTSCTDALNRKFKNTAGNYGSGTYAIDADGANFGVAPTTTTCSF